MFDGNMPDSTLTFQTGISGLFCQITLKALGEWRLDGAPMFMFFWVLLHDDLEPMTCTA